jgi:hypothetical protein
MLKRFNKQIRRLFVAQPTDPANYGSLFRQAQHPPSLETREPLFGWRKYIWDQSDLFGTVSTSAQIVEQLP